LSSDLGLEGGPIPVKPQSLWLELGLDPIADVGVEPPIAEAGLDAGSIGLCGGKPDFLRPGEGEGGIWARVSIVRSDNEGRGFFFAGVDRVLDCPSSSFAIAVLWSLPADPSFESVCREETLRG